MGAAVDGEVDGLGHNAEVGPRADDLLAGQGDEG